MHHNLGYKITYTNSLSWRTIAAISIGATLCTTDNNDDMTNGEMIRQKTKSLSLWQKKENALAPMA